MLPLNTQVALYAATVQSDRYFTRFGKKHGGLTFAILFAMYTWTAVVVTTSMAVSIVSILDMDPHYALNGCMYILGAA
jgi:hypothetical protein